MTVHRIELPYPAPNLNDLNRNQRAAAYKRGGIDELAKIGVQKRTRRGKVRKRTFDMYQAIKAQWANLVFAHARIARVPDDAFPEGAHVHIHIVEADRKRDPDNITSGATKLILDGLVKAKVLRTDGWQGVLSLNYSWDVGKPAVIVTLASPDEKERAA